MSNKILTVKLLIDAKSNKVLFAEAGKDVVDFLLSLIGFPVGSIVKLVSPEGMAGCISNLYKSLEDFDTTYLDPKLNRLAALNPVVSPCFTQATLLLPAPTKPEKKYYTCEKKMINSGSLYSNPSYNLNCTAYHVSDDKSAKCPSCKGPMATEVSYVEPKSGIVRLVPQGAEGGGFVKGIVTYTIMDDLTITPMSTISSITLLNKLGVKDLSALQEKSVKLGFEEGVELLKASLQTSTVLTQVFLGAK